MFIFKKLKDFLSGVVEEAKKIHWPRRELVIYNSTIVIVAILISILIVAGIDYLLSQLISWYIGLK